MIDQTGKSPVQGFGPNPLIAWAKFTQNGATNAAQTLTEGFGIKSITKTGTGLWTIALTEKVPGFVAHIYVSAPIAEFHHCQVISWSLTGGTINFGHVSAATYGAIASAAVSDGAGLDFSVLIYSRGAL